MEDKRFARDVVNLFMKGITEEGSRKEKARWNFLNIIRSGIIPHAEITAEQDRVVLSPFLMRVHNGVYDRALQDDFYSFLNALKVATWINSLQSLAHQHVSINEMLVGDKVT